jgi:chromosomal replication initiator protein
MEDVKIWEEVLKEAKKHCSDDVVSTWIKPLQMVEARGDLITLQAPNRFYKNWVEEKYLDTLRTIFREGLSIDADVRIITGDAPKAQAASPVVTASAPVSDYRIPATSNLNRDIFLKTLSWEAQTSFPMRHVLLFPKGISKCITLFLYMAVLVWGRLTSCRRPETELWKSFLN